MGRWKGREEDQQSGEVREFEGGDEEGESSGCKWC
jgi:hypothetical protein